MHPTPQPIALARIAPGTRLGLTFPRASSNASARWPDGLSDADRPSNHSAPDVSALGQVRGSVRAQSADASDCTALPDELRRAARRASPRRPTSFAAPPDVLLVIDIEGGELDLCELLELSGVRKILVEVHKWAYWSRGLATGGANARGW
jgi:hypothetical protein